MLCYVWLFIWFTRIHYRKQDIPISVFLTPRTLNIKMKTREISFFQLGEEIVCLDMAKFQGYISRLPSSSFIVYPVKQGVKEVHF